MGRPRKTLTEEQIIQVESLAAYLSSEQIADYLEIGRKTFYDIMERDKRVSIRYKKGRVKAIAQVAQKSIIQKALEGNMVAGMFYLKTQAGWRETSEDRTDDAPPVSISFEVSQAIEEIQVTNAKT